MEKFKAILKTMFVYFFTIAIAAGLITGIYKSIKYYKLKNVYAAIPEKLCDLILLDEPVDYIPTVQTFVMPDYREFLFPRAWLNGSENCIFAARLNAMKFAGMIPKHWTIDDFKKNFTSNELYIKWGLHVWDVTLNSKILEEINRKLNPNSPYRFEWISINSMDELIYLAKRKQHVLVGITVWLGPSSRHTVKARKNRNSIISHAVTITGIKSYDPDTGLIQFETYDPLPFNFINHVPTFSTFNEKGWSIFNRHGVPHIKKKGRARSGYIVRILKNNSPDIAKSRKEKEKNSDIHQFTML
jgi:hypothetical protein